LPSVAGFGPFCHIHLFRSTSRNCTPLHPVAGFGPFCHIHPLPPSAPGAHAEQVFGARKIENGEFAA
jgi:hypothetical protein